MRAVLAWQADNQNKEGAPGPCMSVCFNPEGTQLVAAVGTLVLVFNASDGSLVHRLKGHKDNVYAVSYSKDGKRFSSGGADKSVIIWQSNGEGILKYSHNDTIQCVEYNPVTLELASATASDFGIWSPDQKSVSKHKIAAKATSLSWTSDGQLLAIGQFDGCVSVRQKDGVEKISIRRAGGSPVWSVHFNPAAEDGEDILSVGCWDGTLSFFSLAPKQLGKDKTLGYDPCCARYFGNGEYLVLAGSDNKATLWTKDGVQLQTICERADWIWAVAPRPKQNYVAVGCNDGSVAVYQLNFSTVHGLYQDRYAYRDFMTNVTIQHLTTEQKVRIKTKDHVKKIAVYRERLAVQLPDRVLIYELREGGEENDMHYVKRNTVQRAVECNLLVVTSFHIILCQEKKLQLLDFQGVKEREWVLDAVIRYIKVVGGPPGREGLMVGLKDGQVLKIFVDNPFPIHVIKHERAIRCLDLSCMRRKLAVVDEAANVVVYDVMTGERVFEDQNANSVAWNSVLEEQLCYSGKDQLCIKTGDFPIHRERMQGFVVGVRASKVFCLHYLAMNTLYVPQSAAMFRYLERKDFGSAYRLATMGVTDTDWIALAQEALLAMDLDVALKAFIRVRDVRFTELINRVRASRKLTGHDDQVFLGEAHAMIGNFQEAGKVMVKAGRVDLAIKMFSDLKRWDDARFIAGTAQGADVVQLTREQAQWALHNKDWRTAASILVTSEEYGRAIDIMSAHDLADDLIDVVRRLDKSETANLTRCAATFRKGKHMAYAKETYIKMGSQAELLEVYVETEAWEEAFTLSQLIPELGSKVHLPYARWLASQDRFEEAQVEFRKAGRPEETVRMLESLTDAAVAARSFRDAAFFFWSLSVERSKILGSDASEADLDACFELSERAEVYYAYASIHSYITAPFTSFHPEAVFHTARFLIERMARGAPDGVSRVHVLWALSEQAVKLGCFKIARRALDQLASLRLPHGWRDKVDLACIQVRGKAMTDNEELVSGEDVFTGIRSMLNFDILPVVEFQVDPGVSPEQALSLIKHAGSSGGGRKAGGGREGDGGRERATNRGNTLSFGSDDEDDGDVGMSSQGGDLIGEFQQLLLSAAPGEPPICPRETLRELPPGEVLVQKAILGGTQTRYFRVMMPDAEIVTCNACARFFAQEDFEMEYLKEPRCPFCRASNPADFAWGGQA